MNRIILDWKRNKRKKLFETIALVEGYIENILAKVLTFDLVKTEAINFPNKIPNIFLQEVKDYYNEEKIIIHSIIATEDSDAGKELNNQTIKYLRNQSSCGLLQ